MAETVLRFGPEWLRALTDGGVSHQNASANPVSNHQNIPSTTNLTANSSLPTILPSNKYKLAQYRYGREEMLALFDNNIDMAHELKELPTLTVDKCQLPLALIPMSEDEHRLWSRSVNSEAMLRLNKMNTTAGSSVERDRPERSTTVSGTTTNERTPGPPIRTMRGGMTAERSRGRGRPAYYQRTGPYDENGETGEPRDAFRKNYEKSSSISEDGPREKSFDRSLSRGESSDEGNRNRKDVRLADNWRSGGRSDDRNNWRARGRTDDNWNRNDSWRTDDRDGIGEDNHRNGPIMRRGYGNHYKRNSEGWDDMDDEERKNNLPEWSLDDDMSCEARVGTFDASGAFREGSMDDDIKDASSGHNSKDHSDMKKTAMDHNNSISSDSVNMDKNETPPDDSKLQVDLNDDELLNAQPYEESKIMTVPPISNMSDNNIDSQFQLQSQLSHQQHQQPSLLPQIQSQLQNQQMTSQLHSSLQPSLQAQFQSHLQPQMQSQMQPQLQSQLQQMQSQLQPQLQNQLQSQLQPQMQPQMQPQLQSQLQSQMLHQHPPQALSQPQPQSQMNAHHHIQALLENSHINPNPNPNHKPHPEEDGLSHLEKAAENMVAQWTAEADQEERVLRDKQSNKMTVVPLHHEDAYKWFYRDPQGAIQGPFLPQEMYEWSVSGYFTLDLLVRRGCDERFSQLGELVKAWGRMPFNTDKNPPPVVNMTPQTQPNKSINADSIPSALSPNSLYSQNFRQQQILQQRQQDQIQRQIFLNQQLQMQTQLRQLLDQLKKQDGFSTLSAQEQQCVLVQQYVTAQHQAEQRRIQPTPPQPTNIPDEPKSVMEQLSRLGVPVVRSGPLLTQSTPSIWELNGGVITASALEELQRRERDKLELEEKKKLLEKEQIEAQKRAAVEAQRKREEEQRIEELTRKLEHEKKLREELLRDQEERRRREEEDEKRRMEQERIELEREKKRLEEERRKHEEMKEMLRSEEMIRKQREAERKQRQKEAEEAERLRRQEQMQQEMAQARKANQLSQQKQNQLQAQQNQQVKERKENQKQVQNQPNQLQKESKKIWPDRPNSDKADGWSFDDDSPIPDANSPSLKFPTQQQIWKSSEDSADKNASKQIWGQTCQTKNSTISLAEIQRLQEAKEKEEKIKQAQQTERQNIYLEKQSNAQQLFEQQQKHMKNQLTWARSHLHQAQAPVKTLAEIQKEEAQKLEKQKRSEEKKQAAVKQNTVTNAGIWSNAASQLSWKGSSTNAWGQSSVNTGSTNQTTSSSGPNFTGNMGEAFWDTPTPKESKNVSKNQESALQHNIKSSGGNNNNNNGSSGKSKSRKEEEVVMKLFGNQRRQKTDEFTQWCTEALSKYKSSIDIPTFVAFLKDVESPFDVSDYVNSYLGDSKETKDFANQFLEKRSYFRNQAKKEASEELMWGPAPAITPSVNKSSHNNNPSSNNNGGGDGNSGAASKKKKKKAKKVANSILGFTVQSDPDRINAGEIETVDK